MRMQRRADYGLRRLLHLMFLLYVTCSVGGAIPDG